VTYISNTTQKWVFRAVNMNKTGDYYFSVLVQQAKMSKLGAPK